MLLVKILRIVASMLDHYAVLGIHTLILKLDTGQVLHTPDDNIASVTLSGYGAILGLLIYFFYFIGFEYRFSATPGKWLLRLSVRPEDEPPQTEDRIRLSEKSSSSVRSVTLWSVIVRNVMRIVEYFPLLLPLGVWAILLSRDGRRWGDHLSGTVVGRRK